MLDGARSMIEVSIEGAVASVVLNAPPVNAINPAWCEAFHHALDRLEQSDAITVAHISSASKLFCVGADLKHVARRFDEANGAKEFVADLAVFQALFDRLEQSRFITLAEINGAALGGGLELALACDLRVVADDAKIGLPEVGLGLLPAIGGTQRLTHICGPAVAKGLILMREVMSGTRAVELGVAHYCFPADQLRQETAQLVQRLAAGSAAAMQQAKQCIAAATYVSRDGFAMERSRSDLLFNNADTRQRVRQFLDRKR